MPAKDTYHDPLILNAYRQIIRKALLVYTGYRYANADVQNEAIFDAEHDCYLVVSAGWQGVKRIHGCLIHVDIIDGTVWIQ